MTKTETLASLLNTFGLKEVTNQHRTRKYRVFTSLEVGKFYFIGTHGALRKGEKSSDSISLDADSFIEKINRILQKRKEDSE